MSMRSSKSNFLSVWSSAIRIPVIFWIPGFRGNKVNGTFLVAPCGRCPRFIPEIPLMRMPDILSFSKESFGISNEEVRLVISQETMNGCSRAMIEGTPVICTSRSFLSWTSRLIVVFERCPTSPSVVFQETLNWPSVPSLDSIEALLSTGLMSLQSSLYKYWRTKPGFMKMRLGSRDVFSTLCLSTTFVLRSVEVSTRSREGTNSTFSRYKGILLMFWTWISKYVLSWNRLSVRLNLQRILDVELEKFSELFLFSIVSCVLRRTN